VIVGQTGVLRDEGEAHANKLREAEVPVPPVRIQATIHNFVLLNAVADTAATCGAMTLAITWLRQGFSGSCS
jgi:acetyl esterase